MATLILTPEEEAAALWSDLDDAALGRLVKKKISHIETSAAQLNLLTTLAAGIVLCVYADAMGAYEMDIELADDARDALEIGDWRVALTKLPKS